MLNYLWAGLIVASFLFALGNDVADLSANRYGVGRAVAATVERDVGGDPAKATVTVAPADYAAAFGVTPTEPVALDATSAADGSLRLTGAAGGGALPEPLATMAKHLDAEADAPALAATVTPAGLTFPPVRFVKLAAIQRAAFDMAEFAASFALKLVGLLALWLGLVKIGEAAGLIDVVVVAVRPLLGWLFPSIPKDHPALGLIGLNLAANVLGLGNAATPLGLKAMQSLQTLNPRPDTATNAMVMLLALNTASVTLVPPVTLVAVMGLEAGRLTLPIIAVTGLSLVVAIAAAKLLGRLPGYRRSDPDRSPEAAALADDSDLKGVA